MKAAPEPLETMRAYTLKSPDTRWAAYQNADLSSADCGSLRFLAVGPNNTFRDPPDRYPDSALGTGWRFLFVGWVSLETGEVLRE